MKFSIEKSLEILGRTPKVLTEMLTGISEEWIFENEGGGTWSPHNVVGHLIYGEKTDWVPRLKTILEHGESKPFEPYDRFAQFELYNDKSINWLLEEFTRLRKENLRIFNELSLDEAALELKGCHPEFGPVTARQMIAAWTVHDLGHIVQISRTMAKQYKLETGPWPKYLKVLT